MLVVAFQLGKRRFSDWFIDDAGVIVVAGRLLQDLFDTGQRHIKIDLCAKQMTGDEDVSEMWGHDKYRLVATNHYDDRADSQKRYGDMWYAQRNAEGLITCEGMILISWSRRRKIITKILDTKGFCDLSCNLRSPTDSSETRRHSCVYPEMAQNTMLEIWHGSKMIHLPPHLLPPMWMHPLTKRQFDVGEICQDSIGHFIVRRGLQRRGQNWENRKLFMKWCL